MRSLQRKKTRRDRRKERMDWKRDTRRKRMITDLEYEIVARGLEFLVWAAHTHTTVNGGGGVKYILQTEYVLRAG